jgi:hypothetical protein
MYRYTLSIGLLSTASTRLSQSQSAIPRYHPTLIERTTPPSTQLFFLFLLAIPTERFFSAVIPGRNYGNSIRNGGGFDWVGSDRIWPD